MVLRLTTDSWVLNIRGKKGKRVFSVTDGIRYSKLNNMYNAVNRTDPSCRKPLTLFLKEALVEHYSPVKISLYPRLFSGCHILHRLQCVSLSQTQETERPGAYVKVVSTSLCFLCCSSVHSQYCSFPFMLGPCTLSLMLWASSVLTEFLLII